MKNLSAVARSGCETAPHCGFCSTDFGPTFNSAATQLPPVKPDQPREPHSDSSVNRAFAAAERSQAAAKMALAAAKSAEEAGRSLEKIRRFFSAIRRAVAETDVSIATLERYRKKSHRRRPR